MNETFNIGGILDEVSRKLPKLIQSVLSSLYTAEVGTNMGKAVGNFYKELLDSGIPHEEALIMAKDYVQALSGLANVIK